MPSYIPVNYRKVTAGVVLVGVICLVLGVTIGYLTGHNTSSEHSSSSASLLEGISSTCDFSTFPDFGKNYSIKSAQKYATGQCLRPGDSCNTYGLPRAHLAYHLNGLTIQVDGRLDEPAWQQVPWTQDFVDMRSTLYPSPRLQTKVKIRWDDQFLYIAAYLQEHDVVGFEQNHDNTLWTENEFELLIDVDGAMTTYKQVQINALGTTTDTIFFSAAGRNKNGPWTGNVQAAVYVNGTLNKPGDIDNGWTVELALGLQQLANQSFRTNSRPVNNEVWFANFGRAEYPYRVMPGNIYAKDPNAVNDWWSWQPCGATNLHLQSRWGLIAFKENMNDNVFTFNVWHLYKALFDVFEAMKAYAGVNGRLIDQLEELNLPPYLFSRSCVDIPDIETGSTTFIITIDSLLIPGLTGHITETRSVTFDKE